MSNLVSREGLYLLSPNWELLPQKRGLKIQHAASIYFEIEPQESVKSESNDL